MAGVRRRRFEERELAESRSYLLVNTIHKHVGNSFTKSRFSTDGVPALDFGDVDPAVLSPEDASLRGSRSNTAGGITQFESKSSFTAASATASAIMLKRLPRLFFNATNAFIIDLGESLGGGLEMMTGSPPKLSRARNVV